MRPTQFKSAVFLFLLAASGVFSARAEEVILPRVRVYHLAGSTPNLDSLMPRLKEELAISGMEIETDGIELSEFPTTDDAWLQLALKNASDERTVAVLAYACETECTVRLVQVRSRAVVSIAFDRSDDETKRLKAAAATLREILLGPMVGELRRLSNETRRPSEPGNVEAVLLQSPFESDRRDKAEAVPPKLWLEGLYQGDYPHPAGRPLNGVAFGADYDPAPMLGIALHVGWLGAGATEQDGAVIGMQRMTGDLAVRLVFALGPARIGIGAVGRLDLVFLNVDNPSDLQDVSEQYLEAHAGGITTWHLPLPGGLTFVIGAGLTASVLSREVTVSDFSGNLQTALPASTLRMIWTAGLAFSPFFDSKKNRSRPKN